MDGGVGQVFGVVVGHEVDHGDSTGGRKGEILKCSHLRFAVAYVELWRLVK